MSNRPQWMSKSLRIKGAYGTLSDAAKVIRQDAKGYRQEKNKEAAKAAERIANALDRVVDGATWEEAFEL